MTNPCRRVQTRWAGVCLAVVVAIALGWTPALRAQETTTDTAEIDSTSAERNGAIIERPDARELFPKVYLEELSGKTGVRYEYHREEYSGLASDSLYDMHMFYEFVRATARGYVYDHRLLKYDLQGELNWLQLRHRTPERSADWRSDFFGDYNTRFFLFDERPVSADFGFSRESALPSSAFDDRIYFDVEKQTGRLRWRNNLAHIWTQFERRTEDTDYIDYRRRALIKEWETHILRDLRKNERSELIFIYTDLEQRTHQYGTGYNDEWRYDVETITRDLHGYDYRRFGLDEAKANILNSDFRIWRQTGTYDFQTRYLRQHLMTDWTRRFRTHARYLLERSRNRNYETDSGLFETGLRHQLYDSLITRADVYGRGMDSRDNAPRYEENTYGGRFNVDYGKTTAWGYLSAGYGLMIEQEHQTVLDAHQFVVDEPVTLRLGSRARLRESHVVPEEIRVTDISRRLDYVEGLDYRVIEWGSYTYLERILGGAIAENQTVLVSYGYEEDEKDTLNRTDQTAHLRHDFGDWLSLYARLHRYDSDTPGYASGSMEEIDSQLVGMRNHWKFLELINEYEWYDSSLERYEQLRSEVLATRRISRTMRGAMGAQIRVQDYDRSYKDDHRIYLLHATHSWRTPLRFLWNNQLGLERDENAYTSELMTFASRARARFRRVDVSMGVRLRERDTRNAKRETMRAFFEISRDLGGRVR